MSAVRPEFGPTLPEVAGPHLRRLPRPVRLAIAAIAVLAVAFAGWATLVRGDDRTVVVVRDAPVPFNFTHDDALRRTAVEDEQLVALAGERMRFAISPLRLDAYEGDSSGTLPVLATQLATEMDRGYESFAVRQEGRANINRQQGYEVFFQFKRGGATWYGRRVLLLPETTGRLGVDILLEAQRTTRIPKFSSLGSNGPLKVALRSFRFGTERP